LSGIKLHKTRFKPKDFNILDLEYLGEFKMNPHSDTYPRISILLQGGLTESTGLQHEEADRFSIVFKAGDVIHKNTFHAPNTRIISFMPDSDLLNKYDLIQLLDRWMWVHEGPMNILAAKMANAFYLSDQNALSESFFSLLSYLSDFNFIENSSPPSWLQQVNDMLHDEYATSYSVENIAECFGVHPVYLARIFRQYFGCSITEFIRCLRIKKSAQQLIDTSTPLATIALDHGFADQSHFSRQFKKELALAPGSYRKKFS